MRVKVKFQGMQESEDGQQVMIIDENVIDVESFNLKEAVEIINCNNQAGFMVGDKHYFRAIDVVSIEIEDESNKGKGED